MSSNDLTSSSSVRVLGVIIDFGLTLVTCVSIVARNCFYQLQRNWQAKKNLDEGSVKTLIQALVLSRLDYCNSILANLPDVTLAPLVRVQHSAARLIRNLKRRDPVLPLMMELHWLPLRFRITFKLCVLMHGVHYGTGPKYMKELVTPTSCIPARSWAPSFCSHDKLWHSQVIWSIGKSFLHFFVLFIYESAFIVSFFHNFWCVCSLCLGCTVVDVILTNYHLIILTNDSVLVSKKLSTANPHSKERLTYDVAYRIGGKCDELQVPFCFFRKILWTFWFVCFWGQVWQWYAKIGIQYIQFKSRLSHLTRFQFILLGKTYAPVCQGCFPNRAMLAHFPIQPYSVLHCSSRLIPAHNTYQLGHYSAHGLMTSPVCDHGLPCRSCK